MKLAGVYKISGPNGCIYIGSSVSINSRLSSHKSELRRSKHINPFLQNAWNKYGEDAFTFEIIELVQDIDQIWIIEQRYIDELFSTLPLDKIYNVCRRVDKPNLGKAMSEKSKQKLRDKVLSEETKQKISASRKGMKFSEEHKNRIGASRKGKTMSEKAKQNMRAANLGKVLSEEHKQKMRVSAIERHRREALDKASKIEYTDKEQG